MLPRWVYLTADNLYSCAKGNSWRAIRIRGFAVLFAGVYSDTRADIVQQWKTEVSTHRYLAPTQATCPIQLAATALVKTVTGRIDQTQWYLRLADDHFVAGTKGYVDL